MESVSKFYIKVDKSDLYENLKNKNCRHEGAKMLLSKLDKYGKDNGVDVSSFYLCVTFEYFNDIVISHDLSLTQDSVLNAYLQSFFIGDDRVAERLSLFLKNERASYRDLGCSLYNYVLDHSMSFDEFINGEEDKLLYDDSIDDFTMGSIRNPFGRIKTKKKTN